MSYIANNIKTIKAELANKCKLIAVSKNHSTNAVQQAIQAGHTIFGENKVQEASTKFKDINNIELHLIGPLQTNKIKQALSTFDFIQTIDREKLANKIATELSNKDYRCKQFFIQVNIGEEPQKSGIMPLEADSFIKYCQHDLNLNVTGVMCIPPADDINNHFLHFGLTRNFAKHHNLPNISMGMSADWQLASKMGATHIRLGTGIFGPRN